MGEHVSTISQLWTFTAILSVVFSNSVKDIHSPCYGCRLFNILQRDHAPKSKQVSRTELSFTT